MNKKNVSKELIIQTTLNLIEEHGGIKDVNLRGIANKVGCNHTNLYNYYDSLDEIFWETLGQAIHIMMDYVDANLTAEFNHEDRLYLLFFNIIDFSMEHLGWYRLIWLEHLSGEPSLEVINILHKPAEILNSEIIKVNTNILSKEKASSIANIIHSYIHGELCKWLNNRNFISNKEEMKNIIFDNVKQLYKILVKEIYEI